MASSLQISYNIFVNILHGLDNILEDPPRSFYVLRQDHGKILLKILLGSWQDTQPGRRQHTDFETYFLKFCKTCKTDLLAMTTVAPNRDNISAIPLPSPVPPPVINAVLFAKQSFGNIGSILAGNLLELMAREIDVNCDGFRAKLKIFRCAIREEAI